MSYAPSIPDAYRQAEVRELIPRAKVVGYS
jgi:hypothetical protein